MAPIPVITIAWRMHFEDLPGQLAYRLRCDAAETYTVFDYATLAELKQQLQSSEEDTPEGGALACWTPRASDGTEQSSDERNQAVA